DASGRVSLDSAIMLDPSKHGAVACVRSTQNPILLARIVMETTKHRLLVGADADALARKHELKLAEPLSPRAKEAWEKWMKDKDGFSLANLEDVYEGNVGESESNSEKKRDTTTHDTIGVLALDSRGTLAAATSTSGLAFKLPGRVGDSPIVGAGLYCLPKVGAAVCTGRGELMIGTCAAFSAVDALSRGDDPTQAARRVIERIAQTHQLANDDQAAILVLRADGTFGSASILDGYVTAVKSKSREDLVPAQFVLKPK
ncbi:MAG TPA: isoaspartyl peptidase/L-asparaginase, partial [Tepidisphaeraceae bacterium]|nr:isoaspartyl peptidase/L-asparaginase [Tepidisphaeraceae bacterium]